MRILFITNLYPPVVIGGYELACAHTAQAMGGRGHEVRVLTTWCHLPQTSKAPDWVHRHLDLHWFVPQSDVHNAFCSCYANTLQLLNSIRDFRPDVVSVWNVLGIGALAMMDLLNQIGVPWALHLGDRVPVEIVANVPASVLGLFGAQGSRLYERARILSVSQHLLDEIESVSGITFLQGSDIVAGWADLSYALPHEPYLRDGRARFVAASSVSPHKGIDLILEASTRLKGGGLDFSVDVIGDGELRHYIDMVRTLQLQGHIRFLGRRSYSELLRSYAGYDAFLCPTWERDPFPYGPLGAAGCGTPPIITRNCGTSERFVDGVHCIKIDRTVDQLADAMICVATGRVDLARIGRAGRRLMTTDLSFDRYLDRTENALREHARPWQHEAADDPALPLLAFLKHNLSLSLRLG
jgi:glycosyltransferase involved in cell wall biosynthesis